MPALALQRDAESEQETVGQLVVAAARNAGDLRRAADRAMRPGRRRRPARRDSVGIDAASRKSVDRDASGDCRGQARPVNRTQTRPQRHQPILLHLMVAADEDVLPAAPRDVDGRRRLASAAVFARARASCKDNGSIAGFAEPNATSAFELPVVALHGVDHRRRGQDRGRKPGDQAFDTGIRGLGGSCSDGSQKARTTGNN